MYSKYSCSCGFLLLGIMIVRFQHTVFALPHHNPLCAHWGKCVLTRALLSGSQNPRVHLLCVCFTFSSSLLLADSVTNEYSSYISWLKIDTLPWGMCLGVEYLDHRNLCSNLVNPASQISRTSSLWEFGQHVLTNTWCCQSAFLCALNVFDLCSHCYCRSKLHVFSRVALFFLLLP